MNIFRFLKPRINPDYYDEEPKRRRGSSHKEYKNKNANIEYYTDEKGNIRRRKKVK